MIRHAGGYLVRRRDGAVEQQEGAGGGFGFIWHLCAKKQLLFFSTLKPKSLLSDDLSDDEELLVVIDEDLDSDRYHSNPIKRIKARKSHNARMIRLHIELKCARQRLQKLRARKVCSHYVVENARHELQRLD